jgi:hypothetical protein
VVAQEEEPLAKRGAGVQAEGRHAGAPEGGEGSE